MGQAYVDVNLLRQILSMTDGEEPGQNQQLTAFYDQAKEIISRLRDAQRSRDVDTIRQLAAALKPSSQQVGAVKVTARCEELAALFDPQNGRAVNNDSIGCAEKAGVIIRVLASDYQVTEKFMMNFVGDDENEY